MHTRCAFLFTVLLVCSDAADWNPNGMRVSENDRVLPQYTCCCPCDCRTWTSQNVVPQMYCSDCRQTTPNCCVPEFDLPCVEKCRNDCYEPCSKSNVVNIIQASNNCRHRNLPATCRRQSYLYRPCGSRCCSNQYQQDCCCCPCRFAVYPEDRCRCCTNYVAQPCVGVPCVPQMLTNVHSCLPHVCADSCHNQLRCPSSQEHVTNAGTSEMGPLSFSNADSKTNSATNVYVSCDNGHNSEKPKVEPHVEVEAKLKAEAAA